MRAAAQPRPDRVARPLPSRARCGLAGRARGLRFEVDLPDTPLGENVREAVERGDIDGASFRFVVGDEDVGRRRAHVKTVKELHDVTIATYAAYPAASSSCRSPARPDNAAEGRQDKENEMDTEDRKVEGGLAVEDRVAVHTAHSRAGWPTSSVPPGSPARPPRSRGRTSRTGPSPGPARSTTSTRPRIQAGGLGYDQRYAWPAFPRVAVDAGATSVDVFTQTARSLATAANVVRAIDAVTAKPETGVDAHRRHHRR